MTVLVGENSSGKSTFLALTRIAWGLAQGHIQTDFNEEPFRLGAFEQIATHRESARRPKSFRIGAEIAKSQSQPSGGNKVLSAPLRITGTYARRAVEPSLTDWAVETGDIHCRVSFPLEEDGSPALEVFSATEQSKPLLRLPPRAQRSGGLLPVIRLAPLATGRWDERDRQFDSPKTAGVIRALEQIDEALIMAAGPMPLAFAPVRTQPQRTYDPLKETLSPEGSHVPMTLARLSATRPGVWRALRTAVNRFGAASGLFSGVDIRRVGRKESDPFQIEVNVSGRPFNLVDVGYGVSQILPILVDILRGSEHETFLLQQPEVHLHPRAQAELATFLSSLVALQNQRFVVETHSDHLVDRLRMDVRDKRNLKADQVLILYFERQAGQVQVHPIEIDEQGNLVDVPPAYRSFFLDEDRRLLGIA